MTTHADRKRKLDLGDGGDNFSRYRATLAYADELAAERDSLSEKLHAAEREKVAAILEMAKARGLAQDAQARYDWLCYEQHVETEERGGEFQRLYLKLQAALKRAETAERENERLGAELSATQTKLLRVISPPDFKWQASEAEIEQARAEGYERGKAEATATIRSFDPPVEPFPSAIAKDHT